MKAGTWRRVGILMVLTIVALSLGAGVAIAEELPDIGHREPGYGSPQAQPKASEGFDAQIASGFLVGTYGVEKSYASLANDQVAPDIYGDYVVFRDFSTDAAQGDIKLYNRKNAPNTVTTVAGGTSWQNAPKVWGNRVVYHDDKYQPGNYNMWWYDIAANKSWQLTSSSAAEYYGDVWGDWLVYMTTAGGGDHEIVLYNFKTKVTKQLTNDSQTQMYPRIDSGHVVWEDWADGDSEIWWYDIATGIRRKLSNNTTSDAMAVVSGDHVIWQNYNAGTDDFSVVWVKHADTAGSTAPFVFPNLGDDFHPTVQGDVVSWVSNNAGVDHMYVYNTPSNWYQEVTSNTANHDYPAVWGNKLVFQDDRGGNENIYAVEISKPSLTVSTSNPAYGVPAKVTGTLKRPDGTPLQGRTVSVFNVPYASVYNYQLYWTPGTPPFTAPINATTNAAGQFTAWMPVHSSKFYVEALFDATDGDIWYASSGRRTILPKVQLSKPAGKKTVSNTKRYWYVGTLKPKHPEGITSVKIKCYRKSGGKWRLKKTYTAIVADLDATTSAYGARVKLSTEGKWRIRAVYQTTSTNAETKSSWKYITSK